MDVCSEPLDVEQKSEASTFKGCSKRASIDVLLELKRAKRTRDKLTTVRAFHEKNNN